VRRDPSSPVTRASLVAFENMNLVVSKYAQFPIQDRYSSTWQPGGLPAAHRGGAPATCDGVIGTLAGLDPGRLLGPERDYLFTVTVTTPAAPVFLRVRSGAFGWEVTRAGPVMDT